MKFHKETVKCGKCGKPIKFPASGLNHGKMAKAMGSTMYHNECLPAKARRMMAMARCGGIL